MNNLYNVICSTIHDVTKKCANEFNERKTHGAKKGYSYKFNLMNKLFRENKARQMWNLVRKAKGSNNICSDAMDTERLKTYFTEKFSSGIITDIQREASHIVTTKYEQYTSGDNSVLSQK